MATAATIAAKLTLDASGYNSGLGGATKQADKFANNFSKKMSSIGSKMTAVGGIMTAAVSAPIFAGFNYATNAASDLSESINAMGVVFEDAAGTIAKFGETSAQSVGLSEAKFNQLSAVTGAFLTNLGYDSQSAANETINLTKRAADMASVFNTDVDQALGAIQSGLKGEFNPLEQFGVKLNAATIEAKALSMGLAGTTVDQIKLEKAMLNMDKAGQAAAAATSKYGENSIQAQEANLKWREAEEKLNEVMAGKTDKITDNMKAQAALALIMEQTNKLEGDFQNTAEGAANSTRIMQAELENAAAALGEQFIPMKLKAIQALSKLVSWFTALSPEAQKVIGVIALVVAVLGPLILIIGSVISAIGAIAPVVTAIAGVLTFPLIAIILGVIAAIALLVAAWTNNWGDIQGKTKVFVENIIIFFRDLPEILRQLWQKIVDNISRAINNINVFFLDLENRWNTMWQNIYSALLDKWNEITSTIQGIIDNVIGLFVDTDWKQVGIDIIQGIINGIRNMKDFLKDAAIEAAKAALNAAKELLGIHSASKAFFEVGKFSMLGMAGGMEKYAIEPQTVAVTASRDVVRATEQETTPRNSTPDSDSGSSLLGEIYAMLRDLPDNIARSNKSVFEKVKK